MMSTIRLRCFLFFCSVFLFCSFLSSCSGNSNKGWQSVSSGSGSEHYGGNSAAGNPEPDPVVDNAMDYPVERMLPAGVSLQEVGREVYADLLDLEERYNLGGVKLCAEMSADQEGKPYSSFYSPTNITFQPPAKIHLHRIKIVDGSSNIISRIVNGEVSVSVGDVQSNISRTQSGQPGFVVNITVNNLTADNLPVVIPIGQMLEVQAPNVQNIVISNTYSGTLEPYQSQTASTVAYCGAEKRKAPTYHQAKLTPFILMAPSWAYESQQSLWNFQKTRPASDKYYTITFYAWRMGARIGDDEINHKSPTGHAFVDIPEIGVVGYGGEVTNHARYIEYADYVVSVNVNESSLRRAQEKYREWKDNPPTYELARYDCTTFVMDIADAAGIYYGPRWLIQFPAGFMRELRVYN